MRKSRFDPNGVELPDAGGLSGVKRMQMQERGAGGVLDSTGRTVRTGGVMPPSPVVRPTIPNVRAMSSNTPSAVQRLMGAAAYPRRRGQGT